MKKVKYYYDTENLAYRKIKPKKGQKLGVIALFLLASGLFGFLCFVILINTPFFETPKDRLQAREIENMKINYAILNKKMDQVDEVLESVAERDNNLYRVYFTRLRFLRNSEKQVLEVSIATRLWKVMTIQNWLLVPPNV